MYYTENKRISWHVIIIYIYIYIGISYIGLQIWLNKKKLFYIHTTTANDPWLWRISIPDINQELFCPISIFEKRANISHNFD